MSDDELNLALAEESTAITAASEKNAVEETEATAALEAQEVPEVPISAAMVSIEPQKSASPVVTGSEEQELVLQEVEPDTTQPDIDVRDINDEPAPKVGFVKRWTRKIVGWVKLVFKWRKD